MNLNFSPQIVPLQMHIKCNTTDCQVNNQHRMSIADAPCCTLESSRSDVIW
uniref:Uncharacterized protein n=1 Tax=Arundo donax TaxID=35708 RepID=A0A0A9DN23_ARUDO